MAPPAWCWCPTGPCGTTRRCSGGSTPPASWAGATAPSACPLAAKLERSADDTHVLPHVRDTFADALGRAGLATVDDLDAVEVHDCFAMSAYMAIDHVGITAPGDAWKAVEAGETARGGRVPVNPGGGLIGGGHPVGATGVRMLVDATKQVTGRAGATQVDGAATVATLNIGGSTATTCSFVVTSPQD